MRRRSRSKSTSPAIRISKFWLAALLAAVLGALPAHAAEEAAKAGAASTPDAPAYVRFNPIFIPVIKGDRITQQVGITLMLQLKPGEDQADVEAKRHQLADAFFRDLYAFFQDRVALHGRLDEIYLKARLLHTAAAIVGPDAIQEVLIEQLFARRN
jgi:hypothetical protein